MTPMKNIYTPVPKARRLNNFYIIKVGTYTNAPLRQRRSFQFKCLKNITQLKFNLLKTF